MPLMPPVNSSLNPVKLGPIRAWGSEPLNDQPEGG